MSITEIGRKGEKLARIILKEIFHVDVIFQADWIFERKGRWYIAEIKHQERFEKWKTTDIDGHGLPIYQANRRMQFYNETGIRCIFIVIEIPNENIYWQWLDVLEETKYFETNIKHRRIYDIKFFKQIKKKDPEK